MTLWHALLASSGSVSFFGGWKFTGDFTAVDLLAAATNALNGALLARRPDHYKNFTRVGIILMALAAGLSGGIVRDVLLGHTPAALTNPAYFTVAVGGGVIGYAVAYAQGQLFREGVFQLMTSLSLVWFSIVGAQAGVQNGIPVLPCILLAVTSATAVRDDSGADRLDLDADLRGDRQHVDRSRARVGDRISRALRGSLVRVGGTARQRAQGRLQALGRATDVRPQAPGQVQARAARSRARRRRRERWTRRSRSADPVVTGFAEGEQTALSGSRSAKRAAR